MIFHENVRGDIFHFGSANFRNGQFLTPRCAHFRVTRIAQMYPTGKIILFVRHRRRASVGFFNLFLCVRFPPPPSKLSHLLSILVRDVRVSRSERSRCLYFETGTRKTNIDGSKFRIRILFNIFHRIRFPFNGNWRLQRRGR